LSRSTAIERARKRRRAVDQALARDAREAVRVNHCDVALSLDNLADLYQHRSRYADVSRCSRGLARSFF